MKVAIMGSGLSGLSCAITLEKNGIYPDIFESRRLPGDRFINGEVLLNVLNRPVNSCLPYLEEKYGISLKPISPIIELKVYSPNKTGTLRGSLGYSNMRGRHPDSFENQLASQVKSDIIYNSTYTYEQLAAKYTHVIVATGDAAYAEELKNYRRDLTVFFKGAIVEGQFNISHVSAWLNNDFAPKGYGWLIPLSENKANIVLSYPEYPENKKLDPDILWRKYYNRARIDTNQDLKVIDAFETSGYIIGISKLPKISNTYFTGNCFGAIKPDFGFGQFISVLTGVYAAYDICGLSSYELLTSDLYKAYKNSLVIRKAVERLDNEGLDSLASVFDNPIMSSAFSGTAHIDFTKILSHLLKLRLKVL